MIHKASKFMIPLALLLTIAGLTLPSWIGVFVQSPITYPNQPIGVLNSPVTAGTAVQIQGTRCNSSNETVLSTASRTLVNVDTHMQFILGSGQGFAAPGCTEAIRADTLLPPGIPPGKYKIQYGVIVPGRWRSWNIALETEEFEVVAP